MSLGNIDQMLEQMTPEQLQMIASGGTGNPIEQYAAVAALGRRTKLAGAMNAANQPPPEPTVLEKAVNQVKMSQQQPSMVGPNETSQAIPQGVAAIAKAQGIPRQAGGPVGAHPQPDESVPWWQRLFDPTGATSPTGTRARSEGPAPRPTPSLTNSAEAAQPIAESGNPATESPASRFSISGSPSELSGIVGPLSVLDRQGPAQEEEPQSMDEVLASVFGSRGGPGGGGGGVSRAQPTAGPAPAGIEALQRPEAPEGGAKSRARREERLGILEKEQEQENKFQRNMAIAMFGLGLADRGRWRDAQPGLQAISEASQAGVEGQRRLAALRDNLDQEEVAEAQQTYQMAMSVYNGDRADLRQQEALAQNARQFDAQMGLRREEMNAAAAARAAARPEAQIEVMARMLFAASQLGPEESRITAQDAVRQAITLSLQGGDNAQDLPDVTTELNTLGLALQEMVGMRQTPPPAEIARYNAYAAVARRQGINVPDWSATGAAPAPAAPAAPAARTPARAPSEPPAGTVPGGRLW